MAVIHVLDKHTAELIAAGEVVERPASVVKELLENSIDAGATQVTVSIESGGVKLIEISDNGTGIDAEYIPTAFIRHATSKIEKPDDLNSIHTLGFRGEALASIASVARVELLTRTEADEFATCYRISGGEEQGREPAARAVGTTIRVQDLFYNTPARMKFLKKDSSEGTFVADNVGHVALSHPEVSVKFIREGKLQYVTPGDGQLRSAAYAVLGREFSRDLIEVHFEEGLYRVTGLITPPKSCRASRSMQHFYINGRYVRNRTIMAGMEMAFKGTTMQGKFPGGILLLEMPTDLVDVNVHPAKIEARFARENDVFDVVYHAVKLALAQPGTGERRFTFEADEKEKTEKENDTSEFETVPSGSDWVEQYEDDPRFSTRSDGYNWYLTPNMKKEGLDNVNIRKALAKSYDKEAITTRVLKDGSTPMDYFVPQGLATNEKGEDFREAAGSAYDSWTYDVEAAKELWKTGLGELGKDSLSFTLMCEDTDSAQAVAQFLQSEWQNNLPGLTIELQVLPKKARLEYMQKGEYDIGLTRWGPDYADPMTDLDMWITGSSTNYSQFSDADYDATIQSAKKGDLALDQDARWEALVGCEKTLADQCVLFPIYGQSVAVMTNPDVSGIQYYSVGLPYLFINVDKK